MPKAISNLMDPESSSRWAPSPAVRPSHRLLSRQIRTPHTSLTSRGTRATEQSQSLSQNDLYENLNVLTTSNIWGKLNFCKKNNPVILTRPREVPFSSTAGVKVTLPNTSTFWTQRLRKTKVIIQTYLN